VSEAKFFATRAKWRAWLERNHAKESELVVGFHRVGSGRPSITYDESVEEALCFGWIDGVRRRIDESSYSMRFTPRRAKTYWSTVNLERYAKLLAGGRVAPAGTAAYERREDDVDRRYSFERESIDFDSDQEAALHADEAAWAFFEAQPPGYRRVATFWVVSPKREATRRAHLETLIQHSAKGERLPQASPSGPRTPAPAAARGASQKPKR
jgi:uncharacterized protein YdeI (YjbR/CyaY-like superfamily)